MNDPKLIERDALMKFDVVVANPPFSLDKWGAENAGNDRFARFWRGVPPKSKADYGFISHMVEAAKTREGRVGIVVPHGVLFRGGAEARALALEPDIDMPRVVLVTDRIDLDEQIRRTFAACGLDPVPAQSGRHLLDLVGKDRATIVTTLIHKFDTALKSRGFEDRSTEVFLLVDESQRSQHGTLHARMRKLFPNACYLGFTGTPLMKGVNRHAKGTPYRRAKRTPLVRRFWLVQVANRRAPRARVARFTGAGGAGAWEVPVCPPGQAGHGRWNAGAAFRRGF